LKELKEYFEQDKKRMEVKLAEEREKYNKKMEELTHELDERLLSETATYEETIQRLEEDCERFMT